MTTPTTTAPAHVGAPLNRLWKTGLVGAIVANVVVFAIAEIADTSFSVNYTSGSDPTDITAFNVIAATLISFLAGLAVASAIERWTRRGLRTAQILAAAVAIVTIAVLLTLDADTAAKLTLGAMHLITGATFIAALHAAAPARRNR